MGKEADKTRYDHCKANGICVDCKKVPAVPGRVRCEECAEINRKDYKAYYEANKQKIIDRIMKSRREKKQ